MAQCKRSGCRPRGLREVGGDFSQATASDIELVAADVGGDLAYTVHREITSTSVSGEPRDYILRVTQVYRREDGLWKVVHRHADTDLRPPTRRDSSRVATSWFRTSKARPNP